MSVETSSTSAAGKLRRGRRRIYPEGFTNWQKKKALMQTRAAAATAVASSSTEEDNNNGVVVVVKRVDKKKKTTPPSPAPPSSPVASASYIKTFVQTLTSDEEIKQLLIEIKNRSASVTSSSSSQ